uniref:Uncharacterized protein n=1 Tax=Oncorhynchus tshawytscha TaxID=74940 RepID=A0A8C8CHJ4_ONCTS
DRLWSLGLVIKNLWYYTPPRRLSTNQVHVILLRRAVAKLSSRIAFSKSGYESRNLPIFLESFKVAVISRDNSRLEKLRGFVSPSVRDNLTTLVGNVGSEEGAEVVKHALLKSVGKVTDIVSSLGFSWWQGGPPHTQTLKELHWVIETLLFSTFVSWKVFFPLVRDDPNCTYTFITGGAGEKLLMPGTGFLTVGAASTLAFCQVLREEYPEVPCKLNQVKINTGVAPPERMAPGYLNHLDLGEAVATLVERKNTTHTVFPVNSPADLKKVILEGNL